jgi:anti-sigma regulatory factor (Ser/Thr protein kinase)
MDVRQGRMHWDLPSQPGSAAVARRHVAAACSHLGREFHDVAVLLASELVGNAVEHARSDAIHLVVDQQESRFRVEVHDELAARPAPQRVDTLAPRGRGLMLVERLAAEWGVDPSPGGGKQVWFQLRMPPPSAHR